MVRKESSLISAAFSLKTDPSLCYKRGLKLRQKTPQSRLLKEPKDRVQGNPQVLQNWRDNPRVTVGLGEGVQR